MNFLQDTILRQTEERDTLRRWREVVFNRLIRIIGVIGTLTYVLEMGFIFLGEDINLPILLTYSGAYIVLMVAAFYERFPTIFRIYLFTTMVFAIGALTSYEKAAIGDGRVWLLLSVFLAILFLGRRVGLIFAVVASVYWGVIGILFGAGRIPYLEIDQFSLSIWGGTTLTFFFASLITIVATGFLLTNLNTVINESRELAEQTKEQNKSIKEQRDILHRRTKRQEIIAKLSRHLTSLITKQLLLEQAPVLLCDNLDYNNASIFLLEKKDVLRLASTNLWNEQVYPTRDYAISLNEDIIGLAVGEGQSYLHDETHLGLKSVFPETHAYLALPLQGKNEILGALVLQSEEANAFDEDTRIILQVFCDQLALMIENAELLAQSEAALKAERRAYGEITHRAWGAYLDEAQLGTFRRDESGLSVLPPQPRLTQEKAKKTEQVPIRVRGKVIGYVEANKPDRREWTASEKELLRILTSRLETALDSARLYEDSQKQAERERIVAGTSSRMRETLNIEKVLETAAKELRNALGAVEAEVWVDPGDLAGGESR